MNYEDQKKEFALNEKISNTILVFLLLVRLVDQDLIALIFGASVPDWVPYWDNSIAYILTATIIWLNRHRLVGLNIDRPFVVVFILGGALYALRTTSNNIGVLVGITAGLIFWAYQNNLFVFKNPVPYPKGTGLLILLSIILALAPVLRFGLILKPLLNFQTFIATFMGSLQSFLAIIVVEEVIFRGALWAYLQSLGLSEKPSFYTQAFLFWIAHHRILLLGHQYSFWVAIPCMSILLGLLAWRSKSLTPSTIGHFLFNFLSQFLLITFS